MLGSEMFSCALICSSASRGDGVGEAFFRFGEALAMELVSVSSFGVCELVWAMARKFF